MAGGAALAVLIPGPAEWPFDGLCAALWWVAVVVVVRSDLERFIIPDEASLAIAVLGLLRATGGPLWAAASLPDALVGGGTAALNGAAGFALFWLVARVYRGFAGRDGLGFGDVKLAGASAIWLEPAEAALALEIAAVAGIMVLLLRRQSEPVRNVAVPFGAFLAPSAWLVFVSGPFMQAALDRFGSSLLFVSATDVRIW